MSPTRPKHPPTRAKRLRARFRHAALTRVPLWLSGGRLERSAARRPLRLVRRTIVLPDLPDPLDGLRITHLSDLHVGRLLVPQALPMVMQMTNAAAGDLIAVTGDFVDLSLDVLDPVIAALKTLKAPLGVYLVPGNHDYLEDGPALLARFGRAGLCVLMNQTVTIQHHGCPVLVAGIDFAHRRDDLAQLVKHTLDQDSSHHRAGLRLLLAHHPHAFDYAWRHDVDLTLSGHTHGGQVLLSNRRTKKGSIGLASLGFRYPRGLYRRGHSYLYVTSGVGSWFPLRVRCPAEIASLTLRGENRKT